MKKNVAFQCVVMLCALSIVAFSFAGCSGSNTTAGNTPDPATTQTSGGTPGNAEPSAPIVIQLGHVDTEATSINRALVRMSDNVKQKTNGNLVIEIHANSELGDERALTEGLQLGTLGMAAISTAPMANFVKEFSVYDAPFLYRDDQHAFNVADGEVGQYLNEKMLDQGIRVLGYLSIGYRHVFSNKPVKTIEDFKGLKIRTMENSMHLATFQALGALPTSMAFSEVFTALQQKTIDAAENSPKNIVDQKFYEVAKYISKTGHFYCLKTIDIAEPVWETLPDDYKTILQDAAKEAVDWQRQVAIEENNQAEQTLKDNGCTIYDFDIEALSNAIAPVYDQFPQDLPADLLEKIRNTEG